MILRLLAATAIVGTAGLITIELRTPVPTPSVHVDSTRIDPDSGIVWRVGDGWTAPVRVLNERQLHRLRAMVRP